MCQSDFYWTCSQSKSHPYASPTRINNNLKLCPERYNQAFSGSESAGHVLLLTFCNHLV